MDESKPFFFKRRHILLVVSISKFRTVTGVVGIVGCYTLIVCALDMLNSMNYFIKLQFEDLYNFNYKLSLKENITENDVKTLTDEYGVSTSMTLNIEIKGADGNRTSNTIFVDDSNDYVLFIDKKYIRRIFEEQNSWICLVSIIIGLPLGYMLTSYLFKACLDDNYDFGTSIRWWTYLIAAVGTYLTSYIVSRRLSRKVKTIDMVSSLKANE